jgi:hypothetical protein
MSLAFPYHNAEICQGESGYFSLIPHNPFDLTRKRCFYYFTIEDKRMKMTGLDQQKPANGIKVARFETNVLFQANLSSLHRGAGSLNFSLSTLGLLRHPTASPLLEGQSPLFLKPIHRGKKEME